MDKKEKREMKEVKITLTSGRSIYTDMDMESFNEFIKKLVKGKWLKVEDTYINASHIVYFEIV